jgi:hypothetical protein
MEDHTWVVVRQVTGEFQADILRSLLEAQGVPVQLSEEGAARAFGFTVGPMAMVEIMVPENKYAEAREVLARFDNGDFERLGDEMDLEE